MYARSTTVHAHPESIDAGIAYIRDEVMPAITAMDGCVGMSLIVDRESGRCIATGAWQTEETMNASRDRLRPMRERAGEILGGRPQVDEWEIAVLHRDHNSPSGACVRATWVRFTADQADRTVETYKSTVLPALEEMEGFCSASLMLDREAGIAVSSVTYDSMTAIERTRPQADALRTATARDLGIEVLEVCEFELALAHLRVPEMA